MNEETIIDPFMDSGTGSIFDIAGFGDDTALIYRTTFGAKPNVRAADPAQRVGTEDLHNMLGMEQF